MISQAQSPELSAWATGFPLALLHAAVALAVLLLGAAVYALLTPHRELRLVRQGNPAAALSFGGVIVALALPLAVALAGSTSLLDIVVWGASVTVVMLALFWVVDLVLPGLPQRIREGEVAAAALLALAKLAVAIVLAAAVVG